ncbi:TetR/AcrR family transcriptional regulator [Sediminibacillus albus]|uniref:DNA-binding transcriptional regulator, AcrR family n=1 Tax=Sediminibacillus albus TaxID=407036 RepID=A0A1G8WZB8_9BACI|nr:TetR/AcrR family transcriptional regulator [Sediminibacillus albus]SDJ83561.1 DNA-binding transcriptional regulator, AcrR family [Sediminibacillus albus]
MTKTFSNLEETKQQRIISAALKEFAENGFEQASTNRIVKEAGIGKGMLFYYFTNKQELFHYLVQYSLNIFMDDYIKKIDISERDFIERWKQAAQLKMQAFAKYPNAINFTGMLLLSDEVQLPDYLEAKFDELRKTGYAMLYDNIDVSLFREGIDVEKAFQLIRWSIDGYQNELTNQLKGKKFSSVDFDPYWEEFYAYLDVLKTCYYD